MLDILQNTLDGLAIGSAYGLLALGFTLIFGVMRRLNVAFGASIVVGIFAGAWMHATWAAGVFPVFLATLAGAVIASAYVERVSFAWIRGDATLASMASSFAIWMQLEEGVARVFPQRTYAFPTFEDLPMLELGPFFLRPEYLVMFVTAAALVIALQVVLGRTLFGVQVRTLSDNPEAARVAGVNVSRVAFLTFLLAAAIGGTAGFLIAATDGQISPKLGLWATMKGLIAMVIGGLGSLRGALIGGLVLGVVEAQAQWYLGEPGREIVTFALLFLALVLLPHGLAGRRDAAQRAGSGAEALMDGFTITVLSNIALFSFLAISAWILLIAGEISFGQQAYFAIGAYGSGIATAVWQWAFLPGLMLGVVLGAVIGALVAWPTMRLSGLHYAIATLAFAELLRASLNVVTYQREVAGYPTGPDGASGFRDIRWVYEAGIEPGTYLLIIVGCLGAVIALIALMSRGRGMARLRIVGEDPILASMMGLSVTRTKIAAAAGAGAVAALGGGLYAHMATYVEPAQFSVMTGVHALAYGLIGGLGTVLGPILGVLIDIGLLETLRVFSGYRMIVFGGLVAAVLILRPRGLLDEATLLKVRAWLRR